MGVPWRRLQPVGFSGATRNERKQTASHAAPLTNRAMRGHNRIASQYPLCAQVAELADALDSGSSVRKDVEVRILSWAPKPANVYAGFAHCYRSLPGVFCLAPKLALRSERLFRIAACVRLQPTGIKLWKRRRALACGLVRLSTPSEKKRPEPSSGPGTMHFHSYLNSHSHVNQLLKLEER